MTQRLGGGPLKAAVLLSILSITASAATVSFDVSTYQPSGTTSSQWNVVNFSGSTMNTAAYYISSPPGYHDVSVTSDGTNGGTVVGGQSTSNFNGFWVATMTLVLPSGAYNPLLTFSGLSGDDRVVLQLNSTNIGNSAIDATGWTVGSQGIMDLNYDSTHPLAPAGTRNFTFDQTTSGTITSGFHVGDNTLALIVNNTGTGNITSPTSSWYTLAHGDRTSAALSGTFSYELNSSNAPEPASAALLLAAVVPLMFVLRRKRSR